MLLLSITSNSTAQAWVCLCASFTFCKNIPSALTNRQGGGKEEKVIQQIKKKGEREVAVMLVWLRSSE